MNITCNQKFMFCKDSGIDFSVRLCRRYARNMRSALLGISTLPPGTFWDFHFTTWNFLGFPFYHPALLGIPALPPAGWKKDSFQRFNRYRKRNFRCRRDKKGIFIKVTCFRFVFILNLIKIPNHIMIQIS